MLEAQRRGKYSGGKDRLADPFSQVLLPVPAGNEHFRCSPAVSVDGLNNLNPWTTVPSD